jgi:hypothetical protein
LAWEKQKYFSKIQSQKSTSPHALLLVSLDRFGLTEFFCYGGTAKTAAAPRLKMPFLKFCYIFFQDYISRLAEFQEISDNLLAGPQMLKTRGFAFSEFNNNFSGLSIIGPRKIFSDVHL